MIKHEITINLNAYARVRLSPAAFRHYYKIHNRDPQLTADGEYRALLWCLIQDFGDMLGNGLTMPFESAEIILEPLAF